MADESVSRILAKLDELSDRTARLDERVSGLTDRIDKYNNVTGRMSEIETGVKLMQQKCQSVQDAKEIKQIPWGGVVGSIVGGVIVGVIMLAINALA